MGNRNIVGRLVIISFFLSLILQSCGIVQRTMYPERQITLRYECTRNINVFAPQNYKIYYSLNQSNWIYDGVSNGGKHTITLKEKYFASRTVSNWSVWDSKDIGKIVMQLGYEVRKRGYTIISIKILDTDEKESYNNSINLWDWNSEGYMPYNDVSDSPEVKSSDSEMNSDTSTSAEVTFYIEYYDISIEI